MNPILEFLADRPELMFASLVVLEISVVAILALVAIRLNRRDAATRYGLGIVALILIALAAPATWLVQGSGWTTLAWERMIFIDPTFAPIEVGEPVRQRLPAWVWIWGVGVGLVLARVGLGFLRVHLLRRDSIRLDRLSTRVEVYATDDAGPAVVGALKPAVLLPRRLLDKLSDEEIQDVLAHEFAHVAHRHLIAALFQRLLAAVYWPHPLIHLLNRELVSAREEMCDNAVLRTAGAARYARVLLRVAECRLQPRQFSASLGLFGPSTSLERRVKSLLDPNRRIESTMNKRKIVVACSTLALGMATLAGARIQTQIMIPAETDLDVQVPPATRESVSENPVPTVVVATVNQDRARQLRTTKVVAAQVKTPGKSTPIAKPKKTSTVAKAAVAPVAPIRMQNYRVAVAPATLKVVDSQVAKAPIVTPSAPAQATAPMAPLQLTPSKSVQTRFYQRSSPSSPAIASRTYVTGFAPTSFFGQSVPTKSRKRDDLDTYRNMRGEDRPDFLTHPLKFGTPESQEQSRRSAASTYRLAWERVNLSTATPAKLTTADKLFLSRAYESKARQIMLDPVKGTPAIVDEKVRRLFEERVIVKPDLDKSIVYRLKYNAETKKWEVIPPSKDEPAKPN